MTLDESPLSEHQREVEPEEHWTVLAALTEAEDRERYRLEQQDRDGTESVEARERYWEGVLEARPDWYDRIHYERDVPGRDPVERPPL